MLTRKQRAGMRLVRDGYKPADIARITGMSRQSVHQLIRRAKNRIRSNGIDPDAVMSAKSGDFDLTELVA